MEVGQFTIENTAETTWDKYFVRRIMKITSIKVNNYKLVFLLSIITPLCIN